MQVDFNQVGTADAELDECEAAIAEGAFIGARQALERADEALEAVRAQWRDLSAVERELLAKIAKPVSERRERLAAQIPAYQVISEGTPEPEEAEDGDMEDLLSNEQIS